MTELQWSVPAFQDRHWIFEYLAEADVEAAIKLDLRIAERAQALLPAHLAPQNDTGGQDG